MRSTYSNAKFKFWTGSPMSDIHSSLKHQSLGRPLQPEERALADALEAIFRTGQQDFEKSPGRSSATGSSVRPAKAAPGPRRSWKPSSPGSMPRWIVRC